MGNKSVILVLPDGSARPADIPDDVSVNELLNELVSTLKLSTIGPNGRPIGYRIKSYALGRQLQDHESLSGAGISENDRLGLTTDIMDGNDLPASSFMDTNLFQAMTKNQKASTTYEEMMLHVGSEYWIYAVQAYIEAGGDINRPSEDSGWSLLHYAAEHRNAEVIFYLAENGADLNMYSRGENTPLHIAVDSDIDCERQMQRELQEMPVTSAFIKVGANTTLRNGNGETPRDFVGRSGGEKALVIYDSIIPT